MIPPPLSLYRPLLYSLAVAAGTTAVMQNTLHCKSPDDTDKTHLSKTEEAKISQVPNPELRTNADPGLRVDDFKKTASAPPSPRGVNINLKEIAEPHAPQIALKPEKQALPGQADTSHDPVITSQAQHSSQQHRSSGNDTTILFATSPEHVELPFALQSEHSQISPHSEHPLSTFRITEELRAEFEDCKKWLYDYLKNSDSAFAKGLLKGTSASFATFLQLAGVIFADVKLYQMRNNVSFSKALEKQSLKNTYFPDKEPARIPKFFKAKVVLNLSTAIAFGITEQAAKDLGATELQAKAAASAFATATAIFAFAKADFDLQAGRLITKGKLPGISAITELPVYQQSGWARWNVTKIGLGPQIARDGTYTTILFCLSELIKYLEIGIPKDGQAPTVTDKAKQITVSTLAGAGVGAFTVVPDNLLTVIRESSMNGMSKNDIQAIVRRKLKEALTKAMQGQFKDIDVLNGASGRAACIAVYVATFHLTFGSFSKKVDEHPLGGLVALLLLAPVIKAAELGLIHLKGTLLGTNATTTEKANTQAKSSATKTEASKTKQQAEVPKTRTPQTTLRPNTANSSPARTRQFGTFSTAHLNLGRARTQIESFTRIASQESSRPRIPFLPTERRTFRNTPLPRPQIKPSTAGQTALSAARTLLQLAKKGR